MWKTRTESRGSSVSHYWNPMRGLDRGLLLAKSAWKVHKWITAASLVSEIEDPRLIQPESEEHSRGAPLTVSGQVL